MGKRAVILAGGKGTRLYPYTLTMPKPLVPISDDMPIIEIIIRQLANVGFDHITITVNHMADMIRAFCGDGSKWGIKIDYSLESKPLSTMGPLKLIDNLPDNFLVMNGDVMTNLDFGAFYDEHVAQGNMFTISAYERDHKVDYGVLVENEAHKLIDFQEKPMLHYLVSMGVYMVNRKCLEVIPEDTFYGFDHLMLELIKRNTPATVKAFKGYWMDIGRPDDYDAARRDFADGVFTI